MEKAIEEIEMANWAAVDMLKGQMPEVVKTLMT